MLEAARVNPKTSTSDEEGEEGQTRMWVVLVVDTKEIVMWYKPSIYHVTRTHI
jgi:hypothetical protein